MLPRSRNKGEVGLDRAIGMLYLFCFDRKMVHARGKAAQKRLKEASRSAFGRQAVTLLAGMRDCVVGTLVHCHPIQKPRIRLILDVDFNINQQTAFEETSALTNSSLCNGECSSKSS